MAHINYKNISGRTASADYELPADAQIVIVNKTSGETLASPVTTVPATQGTLSIALPDSVRAGAYYLKAQDSARNFIAESVDFYVN